MVAWHGLAWLGVAWRGLAWLGVAWRGLAWLGMACLVGVELAFFRRSHARHAAESDDAGVNQEQTAASGTAEQKRTRHLSLMFQTHVLRVPCPEHHVEDTGTPSAPMYQSLAERCKATQVLLQAGYSKDYEALCQNPANNPFQ